MADADFRKSLQAFVRRRPFKAFQVELVSGDRFTVEHPEALMLGSSVAIYLSPEDDVKLFDSASVSQLTDLPRRKSR